MILPFYPPFSSFRLLVVISLRNSRDKRGLRLFVSQEVLQLRWGISFTRFVGGAGVAQAVTAKLLGYP